MILEALGGVLGIGSKIIDKIWPDKIEAEESEDSVAGNAAEWGV